MIDGTDCSTEESPQCSRMGKEGLNIASWLYDLFGTTDLERKQLTFWGLFWDSLVVTD